MDVIDAEFAAGCFRGSFLSVLFPDLHDTPEGDALILAIAEFLLECGDGAFIASHCPKLFCCFASNYIAYVLATWGISLADDGSVVVPPVVGGIDPILYLKKKMIGDKTCEWAMVNVHQACGSCDDRVLAQIKAKIAEVVECCRLANISVPLVGGSNWPDRSVGCCGVN